MPPVKLRVKALNSPHHLSFYSILIRLFIPRHTTVNKSPLLCSSFFSNTHTTLYQINMASSISHGLVLTTAMVFSATVLYLAFSQTPHSNQPILRSCLCSGKSISNALFLPYHFTFPKNLILTYLDFFFLFLQRKRRRK